MTLSKSQGRLRLLAVVAHPHDITHMAGTCAHHIERGDAVTVVAVTGGVRIHDEKLYDELRKAPVERDTEIVNRSRETYAEDKAHEMLEVCSLFGITDVRILAVRDNPITVTDELVETLVEILHDVRPHILLTHAPYSQVRKGRQSAAPEDHVSVGIAVHRACEIVGTPEYGSQRRPHLVAATYYTGVDFPMDDIDLFVDITGQSANRFKAEVLFTTQAHTPQYAARRIEVGCGRSGWHAGVAYAEPFVRAGREVGRYVTVTDHDLKSSEMAMQERMERVSQRIPEAEADSGIA